MSCRVIRVIATDMEVIGKGTEEDPFRRQFALFTLDGDLICSGTPDPLDGKVDEQALSRALRQEEGTV